MEREVQELAERAQSDIGLDYAWLDDVTYQDWQRYHDLVRSEYSPFPRLFLHIYHLSVQSLPLRTYTNLTILYPPMLAP